MHAEEGGKNPRKHTRRQTWRVTKATNNGCRPSIPRSRALIAIPSPAAATRQHMIPPQRSSFVLNLDLARVASGRTVGLQLCAQLNLSGLGKDIVYSTGLTVQSG